MHHLVLQLAAVALVLPCEPLLDLLQVLVRVALQFSAQAKKNSFHKLQSKMVELESQILMEELKDIQDLRNNKPRGTRRAKPSWFNSDRTFKIRAQDSPLVNQSITDGNVMSNRLKKLC